MRRSSIFAIAALLVLTPPTFADELSDAKASIKAAGLSDKADTFLWCGAALRISAKMNTDATQQKTAGDLADVLLTKAVALILASGGRADQLGILGADYALVVKSELIDQTATPEHTQDECTAAATAT